MKEKNKTVWIDLLCAGSVIRTVLVSRKHPVERVWFVNKTKLLGGFYARVLEKITKKPVQQVLDIVEAEERIGEYSLYELIQIRLTDILSKWTEESSIADKISKYCSRYEYNPVKFAEHLKEHTYSWMYRIVEIYTIAEKMSGVDNSLFVFRKTPVTGIIRNILKIKEVFYYRTVLLKKRVEDRKDYYYDPHFRNEYYISRFGCLGKVMSFWAAASLNGILSGIFKGTTKTEEKGSGEASNIGIELIRSRIRLNEINDLFWLKDSGISTDSVIGIEFTDYDDESRKILEDLSIKRHRLFRHPFRFARQLLAASFTHDSLGVASPSALFFTRTLFMALRSLLCMFSWGETGWIRLQEIDYRVKEIYWKSIYQKLGLRMLWSMYDIDPDKLAKSQALENLDGFFMGSHWSMFVPARVDNKKCYDLFFTWSRYFTDKMFLFPSVASFNVGYPLDFYFEEKREKARELKDSYSGKFIISYMDNIMKNDIIHCKSFQVKAHEMLISLLKEHEDLICFLKPKRRATLDEIIAELPELKSYIDEGRVVVFCGDTEREKVPPATVGMASDLVLGLGISTAAIEGFYSGTVSFHMDLTRFVEVEFAEKGKDVIVFNDMDSFREAIVKRIEERDTRSYDDYVSLYEDLDGFRDGNAYKRIGFVVNSMRKAFEEGSSRAQAVEKVREEYNEFISNEKKLDEVSVG